MAYQKFKAFFICICIMISLLACQFTNTRVKDPAFSRDVKSLSKDIHNVVTTQSVNVNGEEIVTNGKSKSVLTISLINPQNIPADTAGSDRILRHVASIIKYALSDTNEYMNYNVYFVNSSTKYHVTNTTSDGNSYKSEEIKPE